MKQSRIIIITASMTIIGFCLIGLIGFVTSIHLRHIELNQQPIEKNNTVNELLDIASPSPPKIPVVSDTPSVKKK